MDGRTVEKPPKTAAGRRVVAIPAELVEVLDAHLAEHVGVQGDALVFPDLEGNPLGRNKFRPLWAAACTGAGIWGSTFTTCAAQAQPGLPRRAPRCEN